MRETNQFLGLNALKQDSEFFLPSLSVSCVVFGFHEGILKVLLTQYKGLDGWTLPGNFVLKDENIDAAAHRILKERTGLSNVFLKQFYTFGDISNGSISKKETQHIFKDFYGIDLSDDHWIFKRFVTVGYYALADFTKVENLQKGSDEEEIEWIDINSDVPYSRDNKSIIQKAIETIRLHLGIIPIGKELLPDKFTMPDLRILYETILGKPLDRRNFQRKALSFDFIERLNEKKKGGAHKSPILYRIDPVKYDQARNIGIARW